MKHFREFQLDPGQECLWSGNSRLSLTRKAFAVLNCLVENAGRIVTKDELMDQVWPGVYVGEENLKVHIRELRALLGDQAAQPQFIQTYRDRGYSFIAPVTDRPGEDARTTQTVSLCGRASELTKLEQLLKQAADGARQIVFITGEAGIGKTSLVEAFLAQVAPQSGPCVGIGQCIESYHERESFYPVLEAFGRLLKDPANQEFAKLLAVQAPTWVVQFPAAAKAIGEEKLQSAIIGAGRERMLREICESLETYTGETPLILVLEDLHWSDRSTLDFIAAVARRREQARLMVLATYRPVEVILSNHPLRQLKSELCSHGQATELTIELLTTAAVREYLETRFSAAIAEPLAAEVQQKTDGNPLFVVALMEHLIDQEIVVNDGAQWRFDGTAEQVRAMVPDSLIEVIQKQIEQSTEREQEILTAASVVGPSFSAAVVAAGLKADASFVEDCCDSLARRHLLLRRAGVEETPDGQVSGLFQFTHALHRDALYNRSGSITRANLHKRIGEAMEVMWRGQEADVAGELERHFHQSRDYARVVRYLRLEAENAKHRYAPHEALALLETALRVVTKLPPTLQQVAQLETRSQLAQIYDELGDKQKAAELYADVAERAAACAERQTQIESMLNLSRELSVGETGRALAIAEQAVQLCNAEIRPATRVNAETWTNFLRLLWDGWDQQLADTHRQGIEWLRAAGESALMAEQGFGLAVLQLMTGDCAGALETTSEIIPVLAREGDALEHFTSRWMRGWALFLLGRGGESLRVLSDALALVEKNNNAFELAMGRLFLAELHYEAFDLQTAISLCEAALTPLRGLKTSFGLQRALIMSGVAHLESGNLERAEAYLFESVELYAELKIGLAWYYQMPLRCALAEYWLRRNNVAAAREEIESVFALTATQVHSGWRARAYEISARVAMAEGDLNRAEANLTTALAIAGETNVPLVAWRVQVTAARFYADAADASAAHFAQAESILSAFAESFGDCDPLRESVRRGLKAQLT